MIKNLSVNVSDLKEMSILENTAYKHAVETQGKKRGRVRQEMQMESGKGKGHMKVAMKETCKCMNSSSSSVK